MFFGGRTRVPLEVVKSIKNKMKDNP